MRSKAVLVLSAVALVVALAVACGDDGESTETPSEPGIGGVSGGGLVRPNTFLTFDGRRYELVNMLFEGMAAASEFRPVGEASESDIDMRGAMRVFERSGDASLLYTYSSPTADDAGLWLAWGAVG